MRTGWGRMRENVESMETTGRMLRLLSYHQARPSWSGRELAQRLEVTERTLRRDIARLRSLGYPVEATPGRYGGYRLTAGGALPPLLPDDDEAVAVAWGLWAAAGGALPGFEDPALAGTGQDRAGAPQSPTGAVPGPGRCHGAGGGRFSAGGSARRRDAGGDCPGLSRIGAGAVLLSRRCRTGE